MSETLCDLVVCAANILNRSGALSLTRDGNISALLPGGETLVITSTFTLEDPHIARVDRRGVVLEGTVSSWIRDVIAMHVAVYDHQPGAASVVHTHSPYATAWAVAGRAIPCVYQSLVHDGMSDGVPVVRYGSRGSGASIANLAETIAYGRPLRAVLLEHHGVLAWGKDPDEAARTALVVEEAARVALLADALGGAKLLPP